VEKEKRGRSSSSLFAREEGGNGNLRVTTLQKAPRIDGTGLLAKRGGKNTSHLLKRKKKGAGTHAIT